MNWHAKIVNVKIRVIIRNVLQTQIVWPQIIVPFVVAKEATVDIRSLNAVEMNHAYTIPIARQTVHAEKVNVSIHVPVNAKIEASAKLSAIFPFVMTEISFRNQNKNIFDICIFLC